MPCRPSSGPRGRRLRIRWIGWGCESPKACGRGLSWSPLAGFGAVAAAFLASLADLALLARWRRHYFLCGAVATCDRARASRKAASSWVLARPGEEGGWLNPATITL